MKTLQGTQIMKRRFILGLLCAAGLIAGPAAAQEKLRIGYINTTSGPQAVIGKHMQDGWTLALEMLGNKIGGLETEMFYGDDQAKPDVGVQLAERMVKRDRVNFVAGIIWSNVLLAVAPVVTDADTFLVSTNAGASPMAGKQCNKNFISSSWQNDQTPEAMGKLMQDDGVKNVYEISPNYQAGKDMLAGFERAYKGGIKGQILFKMTQQDFQAELSQIRAARPDAVFAFVPGAWGIGFFKQFDAVGLRKDIKLYTAFSVDEVTLPAMGDSAVGTYVTGHWSHDLDNPQNKKFVEAFKKKFNYDPSLFAAQNFDGVNLIDSGVKAVKGDLKKRDAIMAAMLKADYPSVRGKYSYNTNHFPIQNFYKMEVVKEGGKAQLKNRGAVFTNHKDAYAKECKMTS
jgi:branched-chain amino acid transport system substrate-binding protein